MPPFYRSFETYRLPLVWDSPAIPPYSSRCHRLRPISSAQQQRSGVSVTVGHLRLSGALGAAVRRPHCTDSPSRRSSKRVQLMPFMNKEAERKWVLKVSCMKSEPATLSCAYNPILEYHLPPPLLRVPQQVLAVQGPARIERSPPLRLLILMTQAVLNEAVFNRPPSARAVGCSSFFCVPAAESLELCVRQNSCRDLPRCRIDAELRWCNHDCGDWLIHVLSASTLIIKRLC